MGRWAGPVTPPPNAPAARAALAEARRSPPTILEEAAARGWTPWARRCSSAPCAPGPGPRPLELPLGMPHLSCGQTEGQAGLLRGLV